MIKNSLKYHRKKGIARSLPASRRAISGGVKIWFLSPVICVNDWLSGNEDF
jgi:hypothetical protein